MKRICLVLAVGLLTSLGALSSVRAAEPSLVGKAVFGKRENVVVRQKPQYDAEEVDDHPRLWHDAVREVQGDWLRIDNGWVRTDEVVTAEQALDFFSSDLKRQPSVFAYRARAALLFEAKKYDKAIDDYSQAIQLAPERADNFASRGAANDASGNLEQAIADFTEAIRLDPQFDAKTHLRRGWLFARLDRMPEAITDCDEIIRQNPDDADAHFLRGCAKVKSNPNQAADDLTEAIRHGMKNSLAYQTRGKLWLVKRDFRQAVVDFGRAKSLDPADAEGYALLAAAWLELGDMGRAVVEADEAIRIDPRQAQAYATRAFVLVEKEEYERATADCDEAIRLNPKLARAYCVRARSWWGRKDLDQALADMTTAVEMEPGRARWRDYRGGIYLDRKEYDLAIADSSEAIRLDPKLSTAFGRRGTAHLRKKEVAEALVDLNEAIRLGPSCAEIYCERSRCWSLKQDFAAAIADLNEALHLAPHYAFDLHWMLSECYGKANQRAKKKGALEAALEAKPENAAVNNQLAWLLATSSEAELRDGDRAVKFATHACELTAWKKWEFLDTLAAACAEAGDFELAAKWQRQAAELAEERDRADLASRLELYQAKQAYHEEAVKR